MKQIIPIVLLLITVQKAKGQTDIDAIMMEKNALCIGPMYSYSSWNNYWEGTKKRINENLGTVSTTQFSVMGNYGISQKLNLLFSVPYVITKASAGQLRGMQGVQDLSVMVKFRPINQKLGYGRLAVFGIAGASTPLSNYVADYLPLSIGLRSRTAMMRLMVDYYYNNKWFVTASGTYTYRGNIGIDRNGYYTTELVLSDEVFMPNVATANLRAGYRTQYLIAELVLNNMTTLGGFDITSNNMPFPSNRMNASTIGANFKYVFRKADHVSLTGGAHQVFAGRNMGQSLSLNFGLFYVINTGKKETASTQDSK